MTSKKLVIGVGAASLFTGVVIGSVGSSEPTTPVASAPEPSATVTATATATKTVTPDPITKNVAVVPSECIDALDHAKEIAQHMVKFADISSQYPLLVSDAYEAGLTYDKFAAKTVINKMNSLTSQMNSLNDDLSVTVVDYNDAASTCRDQEN